jgi:hypothetical protein
MRNFCIALLLTASATLTSGVFAQLAPPNDSGVLLGHVHFVVTDPDATKKAWVDVFGAVPSKAGVLDLLKLPGIFIIVSKANTPPTGGTNGSVVNHIGIAVKDCGYQSQSCSRRSDVAGLGQQQRPGFRDIPRGRHGRSDGS